MLVIFFSLLVPALLYERCWCFLASGAALPPAHAMSAFFFCGNAHEGDTAAAPHCRPLQPARRRASARSRSSRMANSK